VRRLRRFPAVAPLLPLAVLAVASLAVDGAGAEGGVDPREEVLAGIRAEIARLEERLSETRERESSLEGQLRRVRLELDLQERRLEESTAALELATARADAAEVKVGELETALGEIRDDLRRRLAGMYRLGRHGYLRLFLSLRPDRELLPAIRQLRFLVRRDRTALERYTATRDQLAAERERLAAERRQAAEWRQQEQERRDRLVTVRRRHERLLARVVEERRRLASRSEDLQDKERKLSRLITSLAGDDFAPLDGTPLQEFRGVLDWPAAGEVAGGFGPRRDPRYRTEVPHNGIDLATDAGAEVRAIYPGRVLYASQFEGYGPMVVVYHAGHVFTLYAGLEDLRVGKGDMLSLGSVLGTSTGTLYFEIRIENQPEDPLGWLR